MYKRNLTIPKKSFFLFGPRSTGKTTWLKQVLPRAKWYDLLLTKVYFKFMREPSLLRKEIEALPKGAWVVIDEIQKLPILLNEVHSIIADYGDKYKFALSGSSARKLKRLDANLLAGRVINRYFFPLTADEMDYKFNIDDILRYGLLPNICSEPDVAVDILDAYVVNYLKEEIQQEAFVKDIGSFSRFLEVAAICNGQVLNVSNIAREAGVARPTVQNYFDILVSTLIGVWLPAWRKRVKIKEAAHPKFYFFDPGVVRAIVGLLRDPVESSEKGYLLENLIFHELRAWQNISQCGGSFFYWGTPSGSEIDFIWSRGRHLVAIEVKSSKRWKSEYGKTLKSFQDEKKETRCFGVYLGEDILKDGCITVYPYKEFFKKVYDNKIIVG